jgi:ribosome-associated protein
VSSCCRLLLFTCLSKGASPLENRIKKRAIKAAELALAKKASEVVVLDLKGLSTIADYFVICSGENRTQMRAIAESIDEYFSKEKVHSMGREGMDTGRWILLDYGDMVVHIFNEETRAFYNLDKFWMDAKRLPVG